MSPVWDWSNVVAALVASGLIAAARTALGVVLEGRLKKKALAAANTDDFDAVLATGDLKNLGDILRDQLGAVPLETLLKDTETQSKVYRSLQRLTELVNQPAPLEVELPLDSSEPSSGEPGDPSLRPPSTWETGKESAPVSRSEAYIDQLSELDRTHVAQEIARIAQAARMEIRTNDLWTGLAGARRRMEMTMLPLIGGSRKTLSPRIFHNSRFRGAMGSFLGIANKAIHGEEISFEDAERALRAVEFIADNLPHSYLDEDS
ncbi:MAG: hypothetical protein B7Y43_17810 [Sphingomonas sp. 28-62-20]|uniref:hypothetical protein n=1 Tax=Sphingomonas sp. 28-62-20 TaxID=1970433 RepID=UPI000BC7A0AD|nr:MAG: hypothetical protein B7Y43_17810 [Sphingomonas sp. 28-62-20]